MSDTVMRDCDSAISLRTKHAATSGRSSSVHDSLTPITSITQGARSYDFCANQTKNGTTMGQNTFASGATTAASAATSLVQPTSPALPTAQAPTQPTAIQRRNRNHLGAITLRLQNFSGSVSDLLNVANIQQELDFAFADLEHAQKELKEVLKQYESNGHISNRQNSKRHRAIEDLNRAAQRLGQLMNRLWNIQKSRDRNY